jgi:hypothetical protein
MNPYLITIIIISAILFSICMFLCLWIFSDLIVYCCKCKCCDGDYEALPTANPDIYI